MCEPQSRLQTVENLPAFTCEKPCEVQLFSVLEFRLVCNLLCAKNKRKIEHACDHMKVRLLCTTASTIQTHEGSGFLIVDNISPMQNKKFRLWRVLSSGTYK